MLLSSRPVVALFGSLLLCATSSVARITGFVTPQTALQAGQNFDVTFITSNYIQNNLQYYALFGLGRGAEAHNGALGPQPLGNGVDLVTSGHSLQVISLRTFRASFLLTHVLLIRELALST